MVGEISRYYWKVLKNGFVKYVDNNNDDGVDDNDDDDDEDDDVDGDDINNQNY